MVVNRLIRPHNKHHGGLPMAKCSMSRHNSGRHNFNCCNSGCHNFDCYNSGRHNFDCCNFGCHNFDCCNCRTILIFRILIVAIAEQFSSSQFCS